MTDAVIHDAREYLFALYEISAIGDTVDMATRSFLGTGFFVTGVGDAITAGHVLPSPETLAHGRRLVAMVLVDGETKVCWINFAAALPEYDIAIFKVNLQTTRYLKVSAAKVLPGTDINVVGFPSHQVLGRGLEMRVLKGHVTAVMPRLELNFPVPAGMSGAPVLIGTTAVGFATGRVRSEEIDEQSEELVTVTPSLEKIEIRTTASIIYYGLANTFWMLRDLRSALFENRTLMELIAMRNGET